LLRVSWRRFGFSALAKAAPFRIQKLLTDNGTEFTDRLFGSRARASAGTHEFDCRR
jgi:hypothetical protein